MATQGAPRPTRSAHGPGPARRALGKRELAALRKRLETELVQLTGQLDELEEQATASSADASGEVGFDEEYADAGSSTFERERDMSLTANVRDLIEKVERALARVEAGTYGRCEVCGRPIEPERLDALPYTTLCLADARRRTRLR